MRWSISTNSPHPTESSRCRLTLRQRSVKVYSNGAFTARLADDAAEWVRLLATSGSGDCEIGVEVDRNDGLRRQAAIILAKSSGKTDTVRLRQRGLEERLT